jgi:uncharacterized damage-inducible protein DinB
MSSIIADIMVEFRRHKHLADRAMAQLDDADFARRPAEQVNPVGLIVKHLAGNLASRWRDFLTTDGEKSDRNRDAEFALTPQDTRANLLAAWERGWETLFHALAGLSDTDLRKTVTIRGEPHTVSQALLRGLTHAAYHTGQILYLARLLRPESPWLTIPPGKSASVRGAYFQGAGDAAREKLS